MDPLDDAPEIRYRAEITICNNEIIVFGGGTPYLVYDLQKVGLAMKSQPKARRVL